LDVFAIHHHMQMFVELIFNGIDHMWMPVTNGTYTNTRDHIHIRLSIRAIEVDSLSTLNGDEKRIGGSLTEVMKKNFFAVVHLTKLQIRPKKKDALASVFPYRLVLTYFTLASV
jgi:hypothetical protein